ncbi:MAG: phenylalanine--tRNA ligase subunit beta [Microgenomates group bacterium]
MDILISDNWLRDFVKTDATAKKIAECLSLSGPSVDKTEKKAKDTIYHIEVTTNRVDSASVYGIAREAAAILPRFNIKARFLPLRVKANQKFTKNVKYLDVKIDHKLCPRFTAILIKNVKTKPSPDYIKKRLMAVGERPINNIVDISNYIMHEIGQPVHTFDYDKIAGAKMILRASKKGEKITTLDGITHELPGGDIVIEDGDGRLIDLAGIMGGKNTAIDRNTKNVLLFVQTYNPVNIRKTYISLAQRTEAAALFEKDLDPELVSLAMRRGIDLFIKLTGGKPKKEVLDIYPKPYKAKALKTTLDFIKDRLGIDLPKQEISKILCSLDFETNWKGKELEVLIPSFRAKDISLPEDIIEEVARIYGYHNLPSTLMAGVIPDPLLDSPFDLEIKIKERLKGWGGIEVYTLSMVPREFVESGALRLKNPLGKESEYMRMSLKPSLIQAAEKNSGIKDPFHIFEISNVYLARKGELPEERMMLAGIFSNGKYRNAKGVIEVLLDELNVKAKYKPEDGKAFLPARRLSIKSKGKVLGELGIIEKNALIYYQLDLEVLKQVYLPVSAYTPIPKYPAQIEDITLILPPRTRVGDILSFIKNIDKCLKKIELKGTFKDACTFRIWYQDPRKTLTNKDVEKVREKFLKEVKKKFGATLKN